MTVEQAAHQIGLTGASAVARLRQIEEGLREPTRRQLVRMADKYRRPLLALYVERPPEKGSRAHDLRTLPDPDETAEARLDAVVRDANVRQALLRNALEDADEAPMLPFVGSMRDNQVSEALSDAIVALTNFDLTTYRTKRSFEDAFSYARQAVENIGIYVLLIGDLGHATRKIEPRVFRGLSLSDSVVPFIIINDNDSKSAWTFTLFHELAHILVGESAISGYGSRDLTERVCDDAASNVLLPQRDLANVPNLNGSFDDAIRTIGNLARQWNLSRKMVAYRLRRMDRISPHRFSELTDRFDQDRVDFPRQNPGGGGDYYIVRRHRLGRKLIQTVDRMMSSGDLTSTKAALVLGIKPTSVWQLTEMAR